MDREVDNHVLVVEKVLETRKKRCRDKVAQKVGNLLLRGGVGNKLKREEAEVGFR